MVSIISTPTYSCNLRIVCLSKVLNGELLYSALRDLVNYGSLLYAALYQFKTSIPFHMVCRISCCVSAQWLRGVSDHDRLLISRFRLPHNISTWLYATLYLLFDVISRWNVFARVHLKTPTQVTRDNRSEFLSLHCCRNTHLAWNGRGRGNVTIATFCFLIKHHLWRHN